MVAKIRTCGIVGIRGVSVLCECYLSGGLPRFDVVGLPDQSVRESRDRVHAALKTNGFDFPQRHITVNLAPGELKKEGPIYDLPIFVGLLCASGQLPPQPEDACFVGELTLEGRLRPGSGILPMAVAAREHGAKRIFVPAENAREATVAGGLEVYPVHTAAQMIAHLRGEQLIEPCEPYVFQNRRTGGLDFSDVMGQESVKRPLEIAAAGSHHVLLIGPPGSGKSMLAKRLPSILPDLTREEALECTEIYSVAGLLATGTPMLESRPFRSPHHTVSAAALTGGGSVPRPGEISLAHNGVLFLDELPEFQRDALEAMRQPLEDGYVTVSRVAGSCRYPSGFMLLCAMNPCKCGYFGQPGGRCTCTEQSVRAYRKRISGPLLDRIDLHVSVSAVPYTDLHERAPAERSEDIRARVNAARAIQQTRYAGTDIHCNAQLTPAMMREMCPLEPEAQELMRGAFDTLGLSARSYDRILKVARTIADLAHADTIGSMHVAEAIQYRTLDREAVL